MHTAGNHELAKARSLTLMINGKSESAMIVWLTQTDAEIVMDDSLKLKANQKMYLLVAGFLSLPLRVRSVYGKHVSLKFEQRVQRSLIDFIAQEMPGAGIPETLDELEERAMPMPQCASVLMGRAA